MPLSKLIRIIHRDVSYFFAGMILIYSITGIFLNHAQEFNPYYIVNIRRVELQLPQDTSKINIDLIRGKLSALGEGDVKSYYYPQPNTVKIFIKDGTVTSNLAERTALIEKSTRRPILHQLTMLHRNNPHSWWTWFSDIFAVALTVITLTGLVLVKGKNGITRRGIILAIAGLILPIVAIFLFF